MFRRRKRESNAVQIRASDNHSIDGYSAVEAADGQTGLHSLGIVRVYLNDGTFK